MKVKYVRGIIDSTFCNITTTGFSDNSSKTMLKQQITFDAQRKFMKSHGLRYPLLVKSMIITFSDDESWLLATLYSWYNIEWVKFAKDILLISINSEINFMDGLWSEWSINICSKVVKRRKLNGVLKEYVAKLYVFMERGDFKIQVISFLFSTSDLFYALTPSVCNIGPIFLQTIPIPVQAQRVLILYFCFFFKDN